MSLRISAIAEGIHAPSVAQEEVEAGETPDRRHLVNLTTQSVKGVSRRLEVLQQQSKVDFTVVVSLKAVPEPGLEMLYQTFARAVPVMAECPPSRDERVCVRQPTRRTTAAADMCKSNAGIDFAGSLSKER